MSLSKEIQEAAFINDVNAIEEAVQTLANRRREQLIVQKAANGALVGMIFTARGKKPLKCNGKILEIEKNLKCKIEIVAPAKHGGQEVRADMAMLHEPFVLTEVPVELRTLKKGDLNFGEEDDEGQEFRDD